MAWILGIFVGLLVGFIAGGLVASNPPRKKGNERSPYGFGAGSDNDDYDTHVDND